MYKGIAGEVCVMKCIGHRGVGRVVYGEGLGRSYRLSYKYLPAR